MCHRLYGINTFIHDSGNGDGNCSGKIVLALASTSHYKVGTRTTKVKTTATNSRHVHNTDSSNISGKSSVADTKEIVKRSKRKREKVSRVRGENQLGTDGGTKGIEKKKIRQCSEEVSGIARVSPYFNEKLIGNTKSCLTGNVVAHCLGNFIVKNERERGNHVPKESDKNGPKCDFLVKKNKRRENNVQYNRLPNEHESQNALTSDGCQVEYDVELSTIMKEEKSKGKKNKKEKKRKNPPSIVSLEGDSQVSTIRKVSPFFRPKTHEEDYAFITSSVSSEHQIAAYHGVCIAETDVEDGNDKNDMTDECVSNGKLHPCSRNLKRKKDKGKKSHDLTSDVGQEGSNKMIHKMSTKTQKKKKDEASSLSKCTQLNEQERELDACSAGNKKEDGTCETLNCLQGSTIKKVSPYFQREFQSDDIEFQTNRPRKNASINFEEVLSKYAYKGERMVRREKENDSGEKKKKKLGVKSTVLSAAEKLAEPYRRKDPRNSWKPPRSPHHLLQEDHAHDPWRIMVICMCLHNTNGDQVKQVLSALFSLCPNAEAAVSADEEKIKRVIRSLGLQTKRAAMIKRFSTEYLSDHWTHVTQLHGIGKYAADAYAIFCNGMWKQVTPNDHMLNRYWKFLKYRDFRLRNLTKMSEM